MVRHRNDGLKKRCGCKRRNWSECAHPWYFNFQWEGEHHRFNLDREVGRRLRGKTDADTEAESIRDRIRAGIFRSRRQRRQDAAGATTAPAGEVVTLRTFGDTFLKRYSKARGKASVDDDESMLEKVYAFENIGERPVEAITTDVLEAFFEQLRTHWRKMCGCTRGKRNSCDHPWTGAAGSTFNHYRQLLRLMFSWGHRKGHLSRDPLAGAELPRQPEAKRSRRLSADEEAALLEAAKPNPRLYRVVVAALETGCRRGELLALQWRDVNLERKELRVRAENAKTSAERVVPITTRLAAVLELAQYDPKGKTLPAEAFVFGDALGGRIGEIKTAWRNACAAAGLEDLHFHDLRHEAGSRWLEGGMPIHHVKELLGHANIKTTDTYLNATRIGLQESMRKYEDFRKSCTGVAQTGGTTNEEEGTIDPSDDPQTSVPSGVINGGVDETRTRDLRRDRPAF